MLQCQFDIKKMEELVTEFEKILTESSNVTFLKSNFDILYQICQRFYEKYLLGLMIQLDHLDFQKFQGEVHLLVLSQINLLGKKKLEVIVTRALKVLVQLMSLDFFNVDLMWMTKCTLYLAKLLEIDGKFKETVKFIQNTLWVGFYLLILVFVLVGDGLGDSDNQ